MLSKIGEYTNRNVPIHVHLRTKLRAKLHQKLYLIRQKLTSKINMTVSHTISVLCLAYTTVSTTTNCHIQLGPESIKTLTETFVHYLLPKTQKIMFFRLIIHHNNRNKSINFIFMWSQANKKLKNYRCSQEFRRRRG